MHQFYDFVNACNSEIPHFAVVLGLESSDPGATVFSVDVSDRGLFIEVAIERIVELANAQKTPLLDVLCGVSVLDSDLVHVAQSLSQGQVPYLHPERFGVADLHEARKRVFHNLGPLSLADFAASMAMKDLIGNWHDALTDGSSIADLVGDVDDVIKILQDFKRHCAERMPCYSLEPFDDFIQSRRRQEACLAYQNFDFKCVVTWFEEDWAQDGADRMMRRVKGEVDGLPVRLVHHVVFTPNSFRVEESFALDLDTGSLI